MTAEATAKVQGQRSPRWAFWKRMTIPCLDGTDYLVRLRIVQTPWFGVYLGTQFGWPPASTEHPHGYSVEEINDGEIPWLATPTGVPGRTMFYPAVKIMAGTTLAAFRRLVKAADGNVYEKVET